MISASDYSMASILGLSGPNMSNQSVEPEGTIPRRRRSRTVYTTEATDKLEELFTQTQYPDILQRERLSTDIGVPEARIQVWFQNRRSRSNTKKRTRKSSGENSSTKKNKRKSVEKAELGYVSSSADDWFHGVCEPPTKLPRLVKEEAEETNDVSTDDNNQTFNSFPYYYLPPYYSNFFCTPYFYNPALGHPHYALVAANNQESLPFNPYAGNIFKMPSPLISPFPAPSMTHYNLSPPVYYGNDVQLSQTEGVRQEYNESPSLFSSDELRRMDEECSEQKTHMFVPNIKHATRNSITELSGADGRADNDDESDDFRATSPAFSARTDSSFSFDSNSGSDSGFCHDLSSESL